MNELLIGLFGALVATNPPLAVSNLIERNTGVSLQIVTSNAPAERELDLLMAEDDAARAEVDKWIRANNTFAAGGAGESDRELNARIRARLGQVREKYKDFLQRYPDFARGHLAYGTFLNDIGQEEAAGTEYQKALQLDPKNPAGWNDLGNYCGEFGPITNAFADYEKAIALDPAEPVYYQNLAVTVYLFRTDAEAYYHLHEPRVFDKALALYRKALQLDPSNFPLATDYAESYYGIRPLRTNDALVAWTNALKVARDEFEREGVYIHLARVKIAAGYFDEARAQLAAVTNPMYGDLKKRLERNLVERKNAATHPAAGPASEAAPEHSTNAAPALTNTPVPAPLSATSTNSFPAPVKTVVPTAEPVTNRIPALTNPPPFSPIMAGVLTNVPPIPPKAPNLVAQASAKPPAPEATATNPP
ncbi:MAG: hypothetical protein KGJ60_15145 [Verrucomicrobiota bacterium]|nr:hypothetical protein [Verrucomicrobiota bacterium]MDE3068867.1 hypothetical protein [Verrucomicrobiota bacterium]